MDLPELVYGDEKAFKDARTLLDEIFCSTSPYIKQLCQLGETVKQAIQGLEPILSQFTEPICAECPTGCCVNSHAFPDFEDLIFFKSIGLPWQYYDMTRPEHGTCQFLSHSGCKLLRIQRSYRCTWYFCDSLLFKFEKNNRRDFHIFNAKSSSLAIKRNGLVNYFKHYFAKFK